MPAALLDYQSTKDLKNTRMSSATLLLQRQQEPPAEKTASWMHAFQTSHACSPESLAGPWMLRSPAPRTRAHAQLEALTGPSAYLVSNARVVATKSVTELHNATLQTWDLWYDAAYRRHMSGFDAFGHHVNDNGRQTLPLTPHMGLCSEPRKLCKSMHSTSQVCM